MLNAFEFDPSRDGDGFDDFATHEMEFEFEAGRARLFFVRLSPTMGAPSLLIAPESDTGLLPGELDAVEEFLRRHGPDPEP